MWCCFKAILAQLWTNPNVGFKKKLQLINLTQQLGLFIFEPKAFLIFSFLKLKLEMS